MSKFMNDLKNYFKGELRERYNFDADDMIVFYEAINQNRDNFSIKVMINDCECNKYRFEYIDMLEETGGYIKGEIYITMADQTYKYKITLDNYREIVEIIKEDTSPTISCSFDGDIESIRDGWKNELKEARIKEINEKIKGKELYILEASKEISILKKELESLIA